MNKSNKSNDSDLIKSYTWKDITNLKNISWIQINDTRYQFLFNNLMMVMFPVLNKQDQIVLLDGLVQMINFICFKFNFNSDVNQNTFWLQLIQNDLLDLRALVGMMLPFIDDNDTDDKKHKLRDLKDLYLATDSNGKFIYSTMQYNRCVRSESANGKIDYVLRPFLKEYFDPLTIKV